MRSIICVLAVALWGGAGCGGDNPGAVLRITPSGEGGIVAVTGPTVFTAELINSTDEVHWAITGSGALSGPAGLHVTYTPPPGSTTVTLTATAAGLTAQVEVASSPAVLTAAAIPGLTAPVAVQYDAQDIPHIRCAAARDCFAVQGYVHARDRWFPMDFLRHVARARLAALIGADGLAQDLQIRTLFVTRAGERLEVALARTMDPASKALIAAYTAGVNAYLDDLRAKNGALPGEYAQLPFPLTAADLEPWEIEDTIALARLQQFSLSETLSKESTFAQFAATYAQGPLADAGKMNAWIRAAAPPSERAHTLSLSPSPLALAARAAARTRVALGPTAPDFTAWRSVIDATADDAARLRERLLPGGAATGSNNWAIAAAKSATGAAMIANDPHLALQYPPLFHLAVMTSTNPADGLDLAGGSFPGIPGALVGRGAHVGWGVTVTGYDVTDLYLEQFLPQASCPGGAAGPPCVAFRGAPVSARVVPQQFLVRVGPGRAGLVDAQTLPPAQRPPAFGLIVPHHGPIVQPPGADGRAISVRWTGHEGNTQDFKALFGLNVARDVDAAIAALTDFATGAQNFVLADDQGHIAYDPHALVPVRRFADVRVTGAPLPPWFPLPGDGSVAAEWGDSAACAAATDAPVPRACWLSDDELPHAKDPAKGYLFTANADPTSPSVSDDNNPLAHPPYLSFDWVDSSGFRATRIEQRIEAALAAGKVSLDDMAALQADHVARIGMLFTDHIARLPAAPALAPARAVLAQWAANGWDCPSGLRGSDPVASPTDVTPSVAQSSAGCFLFHAFLRTLLSSVFTDDLAVAGQRVTEAAVKPMLFMLDDGGGAFCNDVDARGAVIAQHTCDEQVATALGQAYATLVAHVGPSPGDWVWGRHHTITAVSQLALVTADYRLGPYARPGGQSTVDIGTPIAIAGAGVDFAVNTGGNVRHISVMDPARPIVKMQLPGPQRDGPAIVVGPDLLGQWVRNTYFDFAFGDQITAAVVATQRFDPRGAP